LVSKLETLFTALSPWPLKSLQKWARFYSGLKKGFRAKPQSRQGEEKERRSRRQESCSFPTLLLCGAAVGGKKDLKSELLSLLRKL
jgi:hypothetical protein